MKKRFEEGGAHCLLRGAFKMNFGSKRQTGLTVDTTADATTTEPPRPPGPRVVKYPFLLQQGRASATDDDLRNPDRL